MAGINLSVRLDKRYNVNKDAKKECYKTLVALWERCVRAFVMETVKYIHIDTGMSAASLYGVAGQVHIETQLLQYIMGKGPVAPHPAYTDIGGTTHRGVKKSIPLGQQLGGRTPRAYKLRFGSEVNPVFVFEFNIVIFQYWLHEFGHNDAPWDSLEQGKQAFKIAWERGIKEIRLLKFILPNGPIRKRR